MSSLATFPWCCGKGDHHRFQLKIRAVFKGLNLEPTRVTTEVSWIQKIHLGLGREIKVELMERGILED